MKYCGIELKSNEARIVCIEFEDGDYEFLSPEIKKIKLADSKSQQDSLAFRNEFKTFFAKHNFDRIGIKERMKRGKFGGGADSFKMEGIIHTLNYPIELIHAKTIKSKIEGKELKTENLNNYQEEALKTALSLV